MTQPWYNEQRVREPGSVILREWNAQRRAERAAAVQNAVPLSSGSYGSELYEWLVGSAARSAAGVVVNERTAMCVGAVFACLSVISGAIAGLPLHIYQRTADGPVRIDVQSNTRASNLWWLFNEQPHPHYAAAVFWEYLVASLLLRGDGFARIHRRGAEPESLQLMHPDQVSVEADTVLGQLVYKIAGADGAAEVVTQDDMLHIPGVGYCNRRHRGLSVIQHAARNAVGVALAADEYQARFFGNGARPDFALTAPGSLNEEQVKVLRTTWEARYGGVSNAHLPAVLTGGLDVKPLNLSSRDQEIIATRQFQVIDIARIFGVPPHMIGETDKTSSWGTGIEQQSIGFVKFTLQRHLNKIQQEINRKLFQRTTRWFAEFNTAGLERGDVKSRYEAHRIALGRAGEPGFKTVNEIRRHENLPPLTGGDDLNLGGSTNAPAAAPADQ